VAGQPSVDGFGQFTPAYLDVSIQALDEMGRQRAQRFVEQGLTGLTLLGVDLGGVNPKF
jgi:hypothetical protein